MDEKRIKLGMTPVGIVGTVFSVLGGIYLILGIFITAFPAGAEDVTAGLVFTVLGSAFLLVAVILGLCAAAYQKRIQNIRNAGHYVWAEIADITHNYNVRINNRYGYIILVKYVDRNGCIHIFRSLNQRHYPDKSILGKQVKVYYENESFKHYYVDLEGVLPQVIEH